MKASATTKQELLAENAALKRRVEQLEQSESARGHFDESPHLSKDQIMAILEDLSDVIYSADAEGKVTFVSPSIEQLTGYGPGDIEGRNIFDLIHKDDQPIIRRRVADLSRNVLKQEEYRIMTSKGTPRWVTSYSRPIFRDGIFHGIRGVISDIHSRKAAEEALRNSEERYRTLFEHANESLFVAQDGRLVFQNPMTLAMTGYTAEELQSRPFIDFIHEADRELVMDRHIRRLRGEELPRRYAFRIIHRDGGIRWVELNAVVIHWNDKAATLNFMSDITDRKRAEERIAHLAAMVDLAPSAITVHDFAGRFLYTNQKNLEMHGYSREELMALNLRDFDVPSSAALIEERMNLMRDCGEASFEVEHYCKDGTTFPLELFVKLVDWYGKPALLSIGKDIRERKRAEEALKRSEEYFRVIIENVSDVIILLDDKGAITYVSPSVERIAGYRAEELIGKSGFDFIMPDELHRAVEDFSRALSLKGSAVHNSFRVRHKNGSMLFVEGIGKNLIDSQAVSGFMINAHDITKRKKAEEELRIFMESVENSSDAVGMSTPEGKHYYQNRAFDELFGPVGENPPESVYVDPDIGHEVFRAIMAGGQWTGEVQMYAKDRRILEILLRAYANKDESGRITALVGIHTDITDRKRAEEEKEKLQAHLTQAQKMESVGTLAGGIAHDFNNLLMGIQGHASLMMLGLDPSDPHHVRLKNIEELVRSGADLTGQLLGFARGGRYDVKPVSINDIVEKSCAMFGRTKKEITIHQKYAQDPCIVEADRSQMEQVFMNLFVNAWQAMPGGGDMFVETEKVVLDEIHAMPGRVAPGRYVKVTITDTGTGMDAQTKERIFDPFFTTKGMGRGTGLGLATVYGIIKGHRGMITVDSEPGQGTTFTLYLPASEKDPAGERKSAGEFLRGTETILLVDDEPMVLEVSRELLESMGYRVYATGSGQEALAVYHEKRNEIDLVVLDMVMPGISGGETFDRLREINPGMKVLLSSGYSINGQAQEILDRGCNGFIQKPFRLEALSRRVREALD